MASKGYVISVATDSRLFEQGVRMGIIKPVEDADDALTDLGKNKGPEQLTDELKDAQRATDKLGDEARQNAKQMQSDYRATARAARQAGEDGGEGFSRATKQNTDKAGGAVREFSGEAKQNIGETFSSFRGDVSDFGQIAQDTLGGLASGLEGIPAVAGVAAGALGIGLLLNALTTAGQESEQFRQDVSDLASDLIETGSTGKTSIGYIVDQLKKMATETDPNALSLKKVHDQAKSLNLPFKELAQAYAGGSDQLDAQIRLLRKHRDEVDKAGQDYGNFGSAIGNANNKAVASIQDEIDALEQVKKKNKEAATESKQYSDTGAAAMQALGEASQSMSDSIHSSLEDAGGDIDGFTKDGVFDLGAYTDALKQASIDAATYQQNLAAAAQQLTPEGLAYVEQLGEAAAPALAAFAKAGPEQQAATAGAWNQAGVNNGATYGAGIKAGLPDAIQGPTIQVSVDRSRYDAAVREIDGHVYRAYVDFAPRNGSRVY